MVAAGLSAGQQGPDASCRSRDVAAGSVTEAGVWNPASGYGLIEASDLDDAIAKAKGCPHNGTIEIAPTFDM